MSDAIELAIDEGADIALTVASEPTLSLGVGSDGVSPSQFADLEQWLRDQWSAVEADVDTAIDGVEYVDASVTKTGDTATLTVTGRDGNTRTATVKDGHDGTDGYSPTASVQRVEGGAEVTVTDAGGTTTAMLNDPTIGDDSVTDAMLSQDGIKAQMASMWGNRLTGSMSGTVLTASDAYAAPPMAVEVDGKSTQVTTTGKNLFDKSTVTPNRYINSSGGLSDWNAASASDFTPVEPNTSYALSFAAACGNQGLAFYTDANVESFISFKSLSSTTLLTFTTPENAAYLRFSCYAKVLDSAQLESGSTATAYEPYTGGKPSPSPDYPQDILSVDELTYYAAGRNLVSDLQINMAENPNTSAGVSFQRNSDGSLRIYGTATGNSMFDGNYRRGFITVPIKRAGTYTVSLSPTGSVGGLTTYVLYRRRTITNQESPVANMTGRASLTFTLTEAQLANGDLFSIGFSVANGTTIDVTVYPQLEVGSTATAYQPYTSTVTPIDLGGRSLRSLPDGTRDTLSLSYLRPSTREGWAWYAGSVTRNIDVYTFLEGFDAGSPVDLGGGWYRYTLYDKIKNLASSAHGLCDRTLYAIDGTIERVYAVGQAIVIRTQLATGTEVSEAFGGGHILYNCTPTTETLDPIELPVLPAPSCTIWATADATPTLEVTYERDVNIAIAALEAAFADLATS